MAKDESVTVDANVSYIELVGIVNSLTAKLAEMGTAQENLAAKLVEQGVSQENLSAKTTVSEEKGYDIGTSEAYQMNLKMLMDEYLSKNLDNAKRHQTFFDQITQNGIVFTHFMNMTTANTADMIAKQAIAHRDIAINSEWKPKPKDSVVG